MSYYLVGLALLSTLCLADKPSSDYGAPAQDYEPPVKYGGPIVYSGEKPPIIHFPPPPSDVSHREASISPISCSTITSYLNIQYVYILFQNVI